MAIAEVNNDHADALLLNRIAYYGIGVAVPYILMRHWEEWEKSRTDTEAEVIEDQNGLRLVA